MNFLNRFSKKQNVQISNFIKIRPVVDDLFHADGQMHRQTEGLTGGQDKAIQHKPTKCTFSKLIF